MSAAAASTAAAAAGAGVADARLPLRVGGMTIRLTVADRERVLDAARYVLVARGYAGVRCREVAERAGMSNNRFYELFAGKEDCLLALLERELSALEGVVRPAYEAQRGWVERVRAGLGALLSYLDEDPGVGSVVFVQPLAAGPRVLACRQEVLDRLAAVVDEGRLDGRGRKRAKQPPALTAQAVVGGVCGLVYSRVVAGSGERLSGLLPDLMASIVLPYRGKAAAKKEFQAFDGRADQGRRERGVLGTRATEDAKMRRAADV